MRKALLVEGAPTVKELVRSLREQGFNKLSALSSCPTLREGKANDYAQGAVPVVAAG